MIKIQKAINTIQKPIINIFKTLIFKDNKIIRKIKVLANGAKQKIHYKINKTKSKYCNN